MSPNPLKIIALVAAMAMPGAALSAEIHASDPQGVLAAVQNLGYRASLGTDPSGDPQIKSALDGSDFYINFYGCQNGRNCQSLQFRVGFDLTDGISVDSMNDWNRVKLVGKAYIDEERDPWLEYFVNTHDGLTVRNFNDAFDWWEIAMTGFKDFIDF